MFATPLNFRTVSLRLERREVVALMMACTTVMQMDCDDTKYRDLHDKLRTIIDDFDRKVMEKDGN